MNEETKDRKNKDYYLETTSSPWLGHTGQILWTPAEETWDILKKLRSGDIIIHYRTANSENHPKKCVGYSKVSIPGKRVTKNDLVLTFKDLDIFYNEYEHFTHPWFEEYDRFYLAKLSNYKSFNQKIDFNEIKEVFSIGDEQKQSYLYKIPQGKGKEIVSRGMKGLE